MHFTAAVSWKTAHSTSKPSVHFRARTALGSDYTAESGLPLGMPHSQRLEHRPSGFVNLHIESTEDREEIIQSVGKHWWYLKSRQSKAARTLLCAQDHLCSESVLSNRLQLQLHPQTLGMLAARPNTHSTTSTVCVLAQVKAQEILSCPVTNVQTRYIRKCVCTSERPGVHDSVYVHLLVGQQTRSLHDQDYHPLIICIQPQWLLRMTCVHACMLSDLCWE